MYIDHHDPIPAGWQASPPGWTAGPAQSLRARLQEWVRRHRSRRLISTLDGAALRDIGVSFSDAETEANKPWWRA